MAPNVVVLTGPTGSGKSRLALNLARRLGAEIVNADSVQVYEGFDIGSGTPEEDEQEVVPHHLYSFVNADTAFDAEAFRSKATEIIAEIHARGNLPLIVGGTGLYVRSLLCGLVRVGAISSEANEAVAEKENQLRVENENRVPEELHAWLTDLDPRTAERLHPSDLHRVRRALAVRLGTGQSLVELQTQHDHKTYPYRAFVVAMLPERERLYRAIEARVEKMLSAGLLEEVRGLRARHGLNAKPFGAIGYRHVSQYLDEALSYEQMVEDLKRDTRRFAKRQLTWWRNQPNKLGWLHRPLGSREAERVAGGLWRRSWGRL